MIGQIGYLGKVSFRVGIAAWLLYTAGMTLGSAVLGLGMALLGAALRWLLGIELPWNHQGLLLVVAGLAIIGGLRDLGILSLPLPALRAQVPRSWRDVFGIYRAALFWGVGIGLGYATMVQYSLYYVLIGWIFLAGNTLVGTLALAAYGLTQGMLLLLDMLMIGMHARLGRSESAPNERWDRAFAFYRLSGVALIALGSMLGVQSVLASLP